MNAPKTILIVDDDSGLLSALVEVVTSFGYLAVGANSGQEALAMWDDVKPQALITDLQMAGMSGLDLVRWAKSRNPSMAIMVMTGYGQQATQELQNLGISGIIFKPFEIAQVRNLLQQALGDAP